MWPVALGPAVVLLLAAQLASVPRAAAVLTVRVGVAVQLASRTELTGVSKERLRGLQLLELEVNRAQATDPFQLPNGLRIRMDLWVWNYTLANDLGSLYTTMASYVDVLIGPYAESTSSPEVERVMQAAHSSQKVIIIDSLFIPGSWHGVDTYPHAFFTGVDGSSVMTDGLRAIKRAWVNVTDGLAVPSMVALKGCDNLAQCSVPSHVCDSAVSAGRAQGFHVLGQYSFEETSLPTSLHVMKVSNPDVAVVCLTEPDKAVNTVVTARALGFSPKAFLMTFASEQFVIDAVGASNANYLMAPVTWDRRKRDLTCRIFGSASGFERAYVRQFDAKPGSQAASAAAAGLALLASVENRGTWPLTAQDISQGLYNLNLNTFYHKLAFGRNRTLVDSTSLTQQVQPLPTSFSQSERYLRSAVQLVSDGDTPLFPMPSWQDKTLEVFPCEAGFVLNPTEVNLTCIGCPAGTQRPSTELECRTCPGGYFNSQPGQASCRTCPPGADCRQGKSTVEPPSRPGFYLLPKLRNDSPVYQACQENICVGGNQCIGGNTGILCLACLPGYTNEGVSFQGKTSVCEQCPGVAQGVLSTLAVVLYLGILMGMLMRSTLASAQSVRAINSVLLKIFVNYMHMTAVVASLTWMGEMPVISFLVDMNLNPIVSLATSDCIFSDGSGLHRYQVQTIIGLCMVPVALAIVYIFHQAAFYWELRRLSQQAYRFADSAPVIADAAAMGEEQVSNSAEPTPRRTLQSRRERAFQDTIIARRRWAIMVVFVLYPAMVQKLLAVLTCEELDVMRLSMEHDVECLQGAHIFWLIAGIFGLVLYGLGIPVVILVMLHRIKDKLAEDRSRQTYGFLYNGFQPQFYYFEAVNMIRKALFLVLGCVPSHTVRTVVMFTLVCAFLGIQIRAQPYDNRDFFVLDHLETASLLALLVTLTTNLMYVDEEATALRGSGGDVVIGLVTAFVAAAHIYCWCILLWAWIRMSVMRYTHFKGECVPDSVSRWGWLLLKFEPNMNTVKYHPETHRMDLTKLTRRERKFLLFALCDTMEWYIANGSTFHPGRIATCLRLAVDICITDRKARARELCKVIAERRSKMQQGFRGCLQFYCSEARNRLRSCFKAPNYGEDDGLRQKLPKGAKTLMRDALPKVGGHHAVIEELQSALMVCERHIIVGKGSGQYFEIDKPLCDFTQQKYTEEDEDGRGRETRGTSEVEEDSKWRYNTKALFGSGSHVNKYNEDGEDEEESPQDVRLPLGKEDGFAPSAAEVGLDAKILRKRQADLAAEARELKLQAAKLQKQLQAVKEPEHASARIEPPAQLPQGNGVRELHLARSVEEDDLKDDVKALTAPAKRAEADPQKSKDMDDFLASLMDEKVGKYWRYTPVNGAAMMIRSTPAIDGPDSGNVLKPGSTFRVSEERKGDEGDTLFLKLADGRGWVFDQKPGVGVMCVRASV